MRLRFTPSKRAALRDVAARLLPRALDQYAFSASSQIQRQDWPTATRSGSGFAREVVCRRWVQRQEPRRGHCDVLAFDGFAGTGDEGAFDQVLQFPHIAGKGIRREPGERLRRERGHAPGPSPRQRAGRKCAQSSGTSSRRSRSGGVSTMKRASRKYRSCRNSPAAIFSPRSALVALITRTSTRCDCDAPTGVISPSSSTRSSFAWKRLRTCRRFRRERASPRHRPARTSPSGPQSRR